MDQLLADGTIDLAQCIARIALHMLAATWTGKFEVAHGWFRLIRHLKTRQKFRYVLSAQDRQLIFLKDHAGEIIRARMSVNRQF